MALTLAKVFKLMNNEYGVQSSDGENVLNALRANKESEFFEEETQDCTPSYSSSSKRKERDEQSEDDDNIDIDVMVQIMEERILADSEVIEDALNDLLNKVEQNIDKKYYYIKVKRLNISFVKLGEECEKCDLHGRHLEEVHGLDKSDINGSTGQKELNKQQADKSSNNDSSDLDKSNKKQTFVDCSSCQVFEMHIKAAKVLKLSAKPSYVVTKNLMH